MDDPTSATLGFDYGERVTGGPAVVGANYYRFAAGERISHRAVMSVCIVWVLHGSGTVHAAGRPFPLTSQSMLKMPWGHSVDYRPHSRQPFQIGTLHLVPWCSTDEPFVARVAHLPGDPLLDVDYRHGADLDTTPAVIEARSELGLRLTGLATYAVDRFLAGPVDEATCRALGELVLAEAGAWEQDAALGPALPVALVEMTGFVSRHLGRSLSVREIADAGGCSPTTAGRLFAQHTGRSVASWVRDARMREAALLLRTTGLRVNEVARQVGYEDPLYFSRVFRSSFGVPPSRYAHLQLRP
jgi:AraC-like DNA-binding protein